MDTSFDYNVCGLKLRQQHIATTVEAIARIIDTEYQRTYGDRLPATQDILKIIDTVISATSGRDTRDGYLYPKGSEEYKRIQKHLTTMGRFTDASLRERYIWLDMDPRLCAIVTSPLREDSVLSHYVNG